MTTEEEAAAAASVFSSKPKTFKMDRRSNHASSLKTSVLRKLRDFLDSYTDEDLAEYIVVLVCNGKNQNQTRDDLEEFLGEDSGKFTAWLWNHLSDEISLPKASLSDSGQRSDSKQTDAEIADTELKTHEINIQNNSPPPNTKKNALSNAAFHSTSSHSLEAVEDIQFSDHRFGDNSLSVGMNAENDKHTSQFHRAVVADYDVDQVKGAIRSEIRSSHEIPAANVGVHSFENKIHKIGKDHNEAGQNQRSSPKKEVISRSFRSGTSEDSRPLFMKHAGGRQFSSSMDMLESENCQSRRSVWDRLGKPSNSHSAKIDAGLQCHATDTMKLKRICSPKGIVMDEVRSACLDSGSKSKKAIGEISRSVKTCLQVVPKRQADEMQSTGNISPRMKVVNDEFSFKRRRQIETTYDDGLVDCGEKVSCTKQSYKNIQGTSPTISNYSQTLKDSMMIPKPANTSLKSTKKVSNTGKGQEPVVTTPLNILRPNTSEVKQENSHSKNGKVNHIHAKNGEEHLNLHLHLHQVEKEILELRSKQAQILKDTKRASLQGQQISYEDIDSRTAFVMNVHFATSREALALHFSKCGPVAKVTILTDLYTGHPKGLAFIAFTSKDSLEKALLLNGTSFMSRPLKVMRKSEMPVGILDPCQSPQPRPPQIQGRSPFQRKHPSSHLQWRRQQLGSGES